MWALWGALLLTMMIAWPVLAQDADLPSEDVSAQGDDPGIFENTLKKQEQVEPTDNDPHAGRGSWQRPPPEIQAEQDPTVPRAATGAIFVPSMTNPRLEPQYEVWKDGEKLVALNTGTKYFVTPGTYEVHVGSGTEEDKLIFDVEVVEGRITYIPVEWSGITIAVVDERGAPFRGSYEIVTLRERRYVGLGIGALVAQGEEIETWLLPPGEYMIVSGGESYQARRNFVTLRLPPGKLIQYTIVLDSTTEDLLLSLIHISEPTRPY